MRSVRGKCGQGGGQVAAGQWTGSSRAVYKQQQGSGQLTAGRCISSSRVVAGSSRAGVWEPCERDKIAKVNACVLPFSGI